MAILDVLTFPDPRLRKKSQPVEAMTDEHRSFIDSMLETMYDFNGIGLAAPQVNRLDRMIVIDTRPRSVGRYEIEDMTELEREVEQPLVIINPELIVKEGKTTYDEGCLSVPSYYETVERFEYIECRALNREGEEFVIKSDGLLSICIQHEIDHLDGKLFIDRLSPIKSNRIKSKIKKFGYPERESAEESEDHNL